MKPTHTLDSHASTTAPSMTPLRPMGGLRALAGRWRLNLPGALGFIVVAAGVLIMLGWAAGIEVLRSIVPGFIVTIPNTALAFISTGAALVLLRAEGVPRPHRLAGILLAQLGLAIGVLTFLERVFGFDFGIDLLLFADAVRAYPYLPPGQMATNSTIGFILAGSALLLLPYEKAHRSWPRELLATAGIVMAALALLGHLFGTESLYAIDHYTGMAPLTAICFALLHGGILLARPDRGGAALLTSRDLASQLVRRLLAVTVFVPVVTGWLWLRGRDAGLFSREAGITLLTVVSIVVLVAVVLQSGRILRRTDREREALLEQERELRAAAESARLAADSARLAAERATHDAEAASRVKSEFVATMSHELRTPLNAIIGYAGLMREGVGGQLEPAHARHVSRIALSAQHLLTLINDVLSIARMDAEGEDVLLRPVDLSAVILECAAMTEPLFLEHALRFTVDVPPSLETTTDPDRLRQIVLNLLSNAAKFTNEGGVTLRLEQDVAGNAVIVSVSDTGPGIAPEHHERIFDAFWQVDMNTTRRHGGTGLGLSLSRSLARLLGGELTVSSEPGAGATFALTLPHS